MMQHMKSVTLFMGPKLRSFHHLGRTHRTPRYHVLNHRLFVWKKHQHNPCGIPPGCAHMFPFSSSSSPSSDDQESDQLPAEYYPRNVLSSTTERVVAQAIVGNSLITIFKTFAWWKTGSSAMLSEVVHSVVDTGNQCLLMLGIRQAALAPDRKHQYGYGRNAYIWSLISAMGMFWLGAGVTISHGVETLVHPPVDLSISWEAFTVLTASFAIDGYVLHRVVRDIQRQKPANKTFFEYIRTVKDPFIMAVFLEDSAACAGVLIALAGVAATSVTGLTVFDSLASIGIGGALGSVAVALIRLNQRFLLGHSVEPEIEHRIKTLLLSRPSIDNVYSVQSQWIGPSAFSYKAEVDFDGTYLAANLLDAYRPVFLDQRESLAEDLPLILAWYAEDVTRLVEKEVKDVELEIRKIYPEAAFIELEPDSKDTELQAIANIKTKSLRKIERDAMNRALAELARALQRRKDKKGQSSDVSSSDPMMK